MKQKHLKAVDGISERSSTGNSLDFYTNEVCCSYSIIFAT